MGNKPVQTAQQHPRILLMWTKARVQVFSRLSRNILAEVCPYLDSFPSLCWVSRTNFVLYELLTSQAFQPTPLSTPIKVNIGSRWAVIDSSRVAVCGGYKLCEE